MLVLIYFRGKVPSIAPLSLTLCTRDRRGLEAPDGDRFIVIGEHSPENLIYDPKFLGWDRSPDFILIQVTSTVGNNKDSKLAFFRYIADELKSKLSVRSDDVMINMVFVDRSD
ncbi:tautomerase family protein [Tunturiibacter gelidoferens]|uniref:tautomerase family protein n=1 Tax=Tunturiibacter gelidiferens TaxID=3069689 RepID=UPI001C84A662|nr:tautomerase family protein [Edaphobacter lichenicola]